MYQDINFTNNHYPSNVVSKLKSIPSSLLELPHNDQAYCTICTQMRGWCLYVCLHSTYWRRVLSPGCSPHHWPGTGPRWGSGDQERSHNPPPILQPVPSHNMSNVPSCTPLSTWSTTVHLLSSAAPAPRPARAQHN